MVAMFRCRSNNNEMVDWDGSLHPLLVLILRSSTMGSSNCVQVGLSNLQRVGFMVFGGPAPGDYKEAETP
jgi:hypothetical protein